MFKSRTSWALVILLINPWVLIYVHFLVQQIHAFYVNVNETDIWPYWPTDIYICTNKCMNTIYIMYRMFKLNATHYIIIYTRVCCFRERYGVMGIHIDCAKQWLFLLCIRVLHKLMIIYRIAKTPYNICDY